MGAGAILIHVNTKHEQWVELHEALGKYQAIEDVKLQLKSHVNYKDCVPKLGESQIRFTLRAIAHLVSPPQEPEESTTIECVDLRDAIILMEDELQDIWNRFQQTNAK